MTIATPAWEEWKSYTAAHVPDIVANPLAARLFSLSLAVAAEKDSLIEKAADLAEKAALAWQAERTEQQSEIARLKAELDERGNRKVYHCMERDFDLVKGQLTSREMSEGVTIRATDTGRELVWMEGSWQDQR